MLRGLNEAQKEAVEHIDGPLLVLAGAGSGKTKTITTRLAYLIKYVGVPPEHTLTLTFTNRAAKEMSRRAISLIDTPDTTPPLLCTFHKFGLQFLKENIERLERKRNFLIIDSDDKKRLIKSIIKDLNLGDLNPLFVSKEISKYKNLLLNPDEIEGRTEIEEYLKSAKVYRVYQERISENNLVDFDDLLALTYKILNQNLALRKRVSRHYQYIMVDEYQDTNELQYRLLRLLTSEHDNICVVGDDDQSIYGWRGANINNILDFQENFKNTKLIKLEINYRSTTQILEASNSLIEHNSRRVGKRLISARGDGSSVELMHSLDESLEAKNIAFKIKELLSKGIKGDDIAVLYRINALSRSLEDGFTREKIKFKLIGGVRFYERAEIKDIISYLRVISNPNDDFSLLRIINKPKRGVGKTSVERLIVVSNRRGSSIFSTIKDTPQEELEVSISKKGARSLKEFVNILERLQVEAKVSLERFTDLFEKMINLRGFYSSMVDGFDRVLNIDEFFGYLRDSIKRNPELTLDAFLNDISLQSEQDQLDNKAINIMSIHASKGLEFEYVFVIGLEEEFFPLPGEGSDIEEERRLGYVALTRAKSYLTLCYCDSRFYRGRRKRLRRSRFLGEAGLIKNTSLKIDKSSQFKKGDLVKHPIFGIGRVQAITKSGKEYKLKINFGSSKKEILSSFVKRI